MFEYMKAASNNNARNYHKLKGNLNQISNNDISTELGELCVDCYHNNMKTLKKYSKDLHFKFAIKYGIPTLALLIGSSFVLKSPKKVEMVPVYGIEQTVICDNKMIKEKDENKYIIEPFGGADISDDYYKIDQLQNVIQYQVKNGTRNVVVTLNLSENGEFKIEDAIVSNFFDMNSSVFDNVEQTTLEKKYDELVSDISDFIINTDKINSNNSGNIKEARKEIENMLKNEKTKIITTVIEYYQIDEIKVSRTDEERLKRKVFSEPLVLLIAIMLFTLFNCIPDIREIYALEADGKELKIYVGHYEKVKFFITMNEAKRLYIKADDARRNEVRKLVKNNVSEEQQKYFK